jgi:hypothetical protein
MSAASISLDEAVELARRPGRYDPGSFWSGDNLGLPHGFRLGGEIPVHLPAG